MSGGDFISRAEGQICARRKIDDRVQVIGDLRRVVKHLGAIAAADQLGLASGDIERIETRKMAISPALLVAMYGAGGQRLLPSLAPRDALDAQVAKIVAAFVARAAVAARPPGPMPTRLFSIGGPVSAAAPVIAAAPPVAKPSPRPNAGPRDKDAHERQVLGEVGTTREALVAILQRARKQYGTWPAAAAKLGIGASSIQNLAGNFSKFSFRVATLLLEWDRANPVPVRDAAAPAAAVALPGADTPGAADAGAGVADGGAVEGPPPEPFEQNSTAAPLAEPIPPVARAAVEGAAVSPPLTPPPNLPPITAGDPVARALAEVQAGIDARVATLACIDERLAALKAEQQALDDLIAGVRAERESERREFDRLFEAKDALRVLVAA